VLVVQKDDRGGVTAVALLGAAPDEGVSLLADGNTMVDVAVVGRVSLTDALGVAFGAPAQSLSDALRLRVDGTWALTPQGLSRIVDTVGGVTVGASRLDGRQVAQLVGQGLDGGTSQSRLIHFQDLLSAVLARLPDDRATLTDLVGGLGPDGATTLATADLASVLAALRDRARTGIHAYVLPVTSVRGTGKTLDTASVRELLTTRLAGARVPGVDVPRARVRDGSGARGATVVARDLLLAGGVQFSGGGAVLAGSPQERTTVRVASSDPGDLVRARRVARALGVPESAVTVDPAAVAGMDVLVVLGRDFSSGAVR
jgi:hypothetical protein